MRPDTSTIHDTPCRHSVRGHIAYVIGDKVAGYSCDKCGRVWHRWSVAMRPLRDEFAAFIREVVQS